MVAINLHRRHDEDGQYRAECLRKVAYYDGLRTRYLAWVDTLNREQLLGIAHAQKIQNMAALKDAVRSMGLREIDEEIKHWSRMAETRADPLVYV